MIACGGCEARILLRLGVGDDAEQPFYVICKSCGVAIRGVLLTLPAPEPSLDLQLDDGRVVGPDAPEEQIVTLHPELPSRADAEHMADRGGSPFLLNFRLLGRRFDEFMNRRRAFQGFVANNWQGIRRLLTYYLAADWHSFDRQLRRALPEGNPVPEEAWQRHDVVLKVLTVFLTPLQTSPLQINLMVDWSSRITNPEGRVDVVTRFARERVTSGEVVQRQQDLVHCLELLIQQRAAYLPALAAELYEHGEEEALAELRILRDDFPALRDLYITTFESCHHVLEYVVGSLNAWERGDPDDFGRPKPASLARFRKLPNAKKAELLHGLPAWERHWDSLLDRPLRNSIGHHSVRHDLPSGNLVFHDGSASPYLELALRVLRLTHPLLLSMQVLKYMHIAVALGPDE